MTQPGGAHGNRAGMRRRQRLLRTAAQQRTRAKRVALTGETPAGQRIGQSSSSS